WTRDIGKAHAIADGVRAGTVWVNCYDVFDAAAPFGGYKSSGVGRELGEKALDNYTQLKTVTVAPDSAPGRRGGAARRPDRGRARRPTPRGRGAAGAAGPPPARVGGRCRAPRHGPCAEAAMLISDTELFLRLGVAIVLGGAIGYERELRENPAGLRTHLLVA